MKKLLLCLYMLSVAVTVSAGVGRKSILLRDGWRFIRQDNAAFADMQVDERQWEQVAVPHDWAIGGPFDADNDRQFMAIEQDGQKEAQHQSGRTGGLPFVGVGWYRLHFDVPDFGPDRRAILMFDGAMSHAQVYVNGREVGHWPYGYNSFYFDVTDKVKASGNVLAVRLENEPESSRWYPGAGLYRNVHLIVTGKVGVRTWGTTVTTPVVREGFAKVKVRTELEYPSETVVSDIRLKTVLRSPAGVPVAEQETGLSLYDEGVAEQSFVVTAPQLWDCDHPNLYLAETEVYYRDSLTDTYRTTFGIRTIGIVPDKGFFLNGKKLTLHGTCNHHDLGPLGAAVNMQAIRYRLRMLKDMGCNAYRTAHNMPSPELVQACNETGMLLMVETFDEWKTPKMANGYHKFFDEWVERDLVNVVRHYRNDPAVVMWCIGNEVPDQGTARGAKLCKRLQDIVHREDPTRPCTQGMDRVDNAIASHVAAIMDIPGFNYRTFKYQTAYERLPQRVVLGSETASTVSSRGVYKFPVERKANARYEDHQSSSYDVEHCSWSDLPEDNFILSEDLPYDLGEFVWTGFDYLGEPTPYYDDWPSHSSLFGIIGLDYLPKDRYYLYRSVWNRQAETLHILPHWTWPGREGEITPVFVYTNYPTVELFVNGKSQGRRTKDTTVTVAATENDEARRSLARQKRYRLMWMDTRYEPGEVRAVAYDAQGRKRMERVVRTAGEPYRLVLKADKDTLRADLRDEDLAFVTVSVVDRNGNLCPGAANEVKFSVRGAGYYKAGANGNPVCLEPFGRPQMTLFNGQMTAIVAGKRKAGTVRLKAESAGLRSAELVLQVVQPE